MELAIAKKNDHPSIIKIYETYENEKYYFILMEYCEGGELFNFVSNF